MNTEPRCGRVHTWTIQRSPDTHQHEQRGRLPSWAAAEEAAEAERHTVRLPQLTAAEAAAAARFEAASWETQWAGGWAAEEDWHQVECWEPDGCECLPEPSICWEDDLGSEGSGAFSISGLVDSGRYGRVWVLATMDHCENCWCGCDFDCDCVLDEAAS